MSIAFSFWHPFCNKKLFAGDRDNLSVPGMSTGLQRPVKDVGSKFALVSMLFFVAVSGLSFLTTREARAAEAVCNRGDILFCEDFENLTQGQTNTGWWDWYNVDNTPIIDTFGRNGSRSLRHLIPASSTGSLQGGMARHTVVPSIGTRDTMYMRFYAYWSPGFQWTPGGSGSKFVYFNSWPQLTSGNSNWRIRFAYQNITGSGNPVGGNPNAGARIEFDSVPIDNVHEANQPNPITLLPGQWYCIELYTKLNTPGSSDGEVKWWINSVLQGSYTNFSVRGSQAEPINGITFDNYFGGAEIFPHPEQYTWRDDVVVSTNPIGCTSGSSSPIAAPGRLRVQ